MSLALGRIGNAIRARGILRAAQARQAICSNRRAAAAHGDDRDPYGGPWVGSAFRFVNSGMGLI